VSVSVKEIKSCDIAAFQKIAHALGLPYELQTVVLQTSEGEMRVEAFVSGYFCVHPGMISDTWGVTHCPSGMAVGGHRLQIGLAAQHLTQLHNAQLDLPDSSTTLLRTRPDYNDLSELAKQFYTDLENHNEGLVNISTQTKYEEVYCG
jgi:hypothetical protein